MLIDKDDYGDPRKITKWVLGGVVTGAIIVLVAQVITKCIP